MAEENPKSKVFKKAEKSEADAFIEQSLAEQQGEGGDNKPPPTREGDRVFSVDGGNKTYSDPDWYCDNAVVTSSYTLLNFVPKNLFEQFHNVANLYFLFIGILQMIPAVTTTGGSPTMYQTLVIIVLVSAFRAATEDYAKHKADKERNDYKYSVLKHENDGEGFRPVRSGDIAVGDIVKVLKDEMIPADMIFLGSALAKGHCFIDKANLNGETSLEVLSSLPQTRKMFRDDQHVGRLRAKFTVEAPNPKFDSLRAHMHLIDSNTHVDVTGKVLMMRETNLRNVDYVYGLVVYTGGDTKIQQSSKSGATAGMKMSKVMAMVDRFLVGMLCMQALMCAAGAIAAGLWHRNHQNDWYLQLTSNSALVGFYAFWSWIILMAQMVPISLIVSTEIVKYIMGMVMMKDLNMYYEPIDKPLKVNRSTIHEDLGLVDYVFSDKTGTLTQNKMEFRYAVCPAAPAPAQAPDMSSMNPATKALALSMPKALPTCEFGSKETEIARSVKRRQSEVRAIQAGAKRKLPKWSDTVKPLKPTPKDVPDDAEAEGGRCCGPSGFCAPGTLLGRLWHQDPPAADDDGDNGDDDADIVANEFSERERREMLLAMWGPPSPGHTAEQDAAKKQMVRTYMLHMAMSNTIKPYTDDETGELKFQAESAEELAMVRFAKSMGYTKLTQNPSRLEIQKYDTDLNPTETVVWEFRHVATFGFSSKRARVTVVYQRTDDGSNAIHVMSKGQDTMMMTLIQPHTIAPSVDALSNLALECGSNGLRTLLGAYAELPQEWWAERQGEYLRVTTLDETEVSKSHKQHKDGPVDGCEKCAVEHFFEQCEKDAKLAYLGVVGMEDQLQLLVPDTIRDYLRAGIKVWMLTGDKLEAAKNIGLACNLIDADMQPQLHGKVDVEACANAVAESRLIEVTGQWSRLANDTTELIALFKALDRDNNGSLDFDELAFCLEALQFTSMDKLHALFTASDEDNSGTLDQQEFITLMQSCSLSLFDAIKFDIEAGVRRYKAISDHEAEPVSMLLNRNAFLAMWPVGKDAEGVTEEQLETLRKDFFWLASVSKSVVFSQAQPNMKKKMVTEIQARVPGCTTLAIGDGANDTDMIMAANVGVGIAGVEGTAAVNSADYAIGTFRMGHELIFTHGFWSYQRVSKLILFMFYKAMLLAMTQFCFGFQSGFSGQQFYNDPILQLYNVMFTALPVMVVGIWDQMLPQKILQNNPAAFRAAKHKAFSVNVFTGWIAMGMLHSGIIYGLPFATIAKQDILAGTYNGDDGDTFGLMYFSTIVYIALVLVPTATVMLDMHTVNLIAIISVLLSACSLFLFVWLLGAFSWTWLNPGLYTVVNRMYTSPRFWLVVILTVAVPLVLEVVRRFVRALYWPSLTQILRERMRLAPKGRQNDVVMTEEDEETWRARKPKAPPIVKMARLKSPQLSARKAPAVRGAVVQAMLRLRNLTGSAFDSAADHRNQDHDSFVAQKGNGPHPAQPEEESKEEVEYEL